ncbi:hypothetical protein VK792_02770 [Mesobacterium sp. TK19101]|uniref:Uncharacterized protein n=1 Tax=Mesobacterium hydrothermale TaxID=3111907 RepID=A0ABU6HDX8_9RHOB|nr:hypothetical protein [Mesobacterium sp. TK19101]MEC3860196.1 hypothetical protein [Mesobacterium sp. TK19101]
MADPTQQELAEIAETRAEIFRPAWFGRLFGARLGLGETFWSGHVGLQLVAMPLWLLLVVVVPTVAPGLRAGSLLLFFIGSAIVTLLVTQAVVRVALAGRHGLWGWIASLFSLLISAQSLALLGMWLSGKL